VIEVGKFSRKFHRHEDCRPSLAYSRYAC